MSLNISRLRTVSDSSTTFVGPDRNTAISGALSGSGTPATNYTPRLYFGWPGLAPYSNDNGLPKLTPSYVWDSTIGNGERIGVAARTSFISNPGAIALSIAVSIAVFCDNAHDTQIQIFRQGEPFPYATITPKDTFGVPLPLSDGSMTPIDEPGPTFNWQDIRFYSSNIILTPADAPYSVVLSIEGQNYISSGPNPAGIAFVMDSYFITES
ncbi:hypothetical protein [Cohnella candidum]|uniref:Uncharacterized protein n=1 Tax=Cohnella candidum TaxID=2674991 RepID=A0A3G3K1T8_9BACL|nr:hypothetical protein [Cohnella candidum]AYQ74392.1 hypothetical protein EAV92_18540 [Cohnella candidum]